MKFKYVPLFMLALTIILGIVSLTIHPLPVVIVLMPVLMFVVPLILFIIMGLIIALINHLLQDRD